MLRVPNQIRLREVTHVSLTQWLALKECSLKGLLPFASLEVPLPDTLPTRAALVGRFHHRMMELAATTADNTSLEVEIEEEIFSLQQEVSAFRHLLVRGSVSGWDEVNVSASHAMRIVKERPWAQRVALRRVEKTLWSADGLLVGRPDNFGIDGTSAYLVEYKSVGLRNGIGNVDPRYVDQILFYGALIFDNYAVDRVVARVESLGGEQFEKVVVMSETRDFQDSVRAEIDRVNVRVRAEETSSSLAGPSADACATCRGRVLCERFKSEQGQLDLEGERLVIEGLLSSMSPTATVAVTRLTLSDVNRRRVLDIDAPSSEVTDASLGMRLILIDVRARGGAFEWGYGTRVFRGD